MDPGSPCTGTPTSHPGAWTLSVDVGPHGTKATLSDGTTGTVAPGPPRTIHWSNGIVYTETSGCDLSGTWSASDGSMITIAMDPGSPCTGAPTSHPGAWTLSVDVGPHGTKVTLSDGTTGTVAPGPPRTIHWSNGIVYTETSGCDLSGTWSASDGSMITIAMDP